MTMKEIESLRRNIDELRWAVRKANPFLVYAAAGLYYLPCEEREG